MKNYLCIFIFVGLLVLISASLRAQQPQPDTLNRIGYLDHSLLREEFKAYKTARTAQMAKYQSLKSAHEQKLKDVDKAHEEKRRIDSLLGGKAKKEIEEEISTRKAALEEELVHSKKTIHTENIAIMQEHEKKIRQAILDVMRDLVLADVKPLEKGKLPEKESDITSLVLKKLN